MSAKYEDRMKDYVPVNERIDAFIKEWPLGCLQSEIVELTETRVTVKAYAYRDQEDPKPGIGHSSVNIPGSTPYTKGSEIENAETSAWGRAIAALGFEVRRGIASTEEVRNKEAGRGAKTKPESGPVPGPSLDQIKQRLLERASEHHIANDRLAELIREYVPAGSDADAVMAGFIKLGTDVATGKHDPQEPSGDATDGRPGLTEEQFAAVEKKVEAMTDDEALAAGAALVGKS